MSLTEIIVALVLALIAAVPTYVVLQRGRRADKVAAVKAEEAAETSAVRTLYGGYGDLLSRVQKDNTELRERLAVAEERIALLEKRITQLLELLENRSEEELA